MMEPVNKLSLSNLIVQSLAQSLDNEDMKVKLAFAIKDLYDKKEMQFYKKKASRIRENNKHNIINFF